MSSTGLGVTLAGVPLVLDPRGSVVIPDARVGFVADLHLGKSTLFRRRGLAVPEGEEARDLRRLDAVIADHGLRRLVILGDLVHAAGGLAPEVVERFAAWRARAAVGSITLVLGNHDRPLLVPSRWGLEVVEGPVGLGPVEARHEPPASGASHDGRLVLAGHLHPVVRLREGGRGAGLRPRCFWWSDPVLVLPAFGGFTGGYPVRPAGRDRVFVVPPADEPDDLPVVEVG
ncbi:ligase-associated DNA damage response endonuclease PdeM [Gemmatimonadota bacterium Y43]|uniref:ligase-associated DNA damage response endonuclease PdeM n=1 Tax=Gaopeijia maritima TaxID=3119007 RepID=UPI00326DD8F3